MEHIEKSWHLICYELFKFQQNSQIETYLQSPEFAQLLYTLEEKTIIVFGWDGSMLSAIREFAHLNAPFLWINFWTKWFLMHEVRQVHGKMQKEFFPILENHLSSPEWDKTFFAFNEVDIRAGNGRIITLEIELDGCALQIAGDGIIISTPSWSTGYNSSLWWPIIPQDIQAFVLTSKAPWNPKWQTPILFSQEKTLHIKNIWRKNTLEIYADSHFIYSGTWESFQMTLKKSSKQIAFLVPKSSLISWKNKLLQEQWFWATQKNS